MIYRVYMYGLLADKPNKSVELGFYKKEDKLSDLLLTVLADVFYELNSENPIWKLESFEFSKTLDEFGFILNASSERPYGEKTKKIVVLFYLIDRWFKKEPFMAESLLTHQDSGMRKITKQILDEYS